MLCLSSFSHAPATSSVVPHSTRSRAPATDGETAKARKGTSWDRIADIVKIADERWYGERAKGGLSSGEGLINEVRDPVQKWNPKEKQFETLDPGIPPDGRGGDHCCLQALSKTKDNFVWEPIALQTNGCDPRSQGCSCGRLACGRFQD